MARALFLDRDGTLIIDKVYLSDPSGVELLPGVPEGLKKARALGYKLFLFSNQSGIGRGYFKMEDALRVNARMEELLGLPSPVFDDICLAPEAPDQPQVYRKPSPRFILEMIDKHALAPEECFMVGDSLADIQAGLAGGVRVAALRTGKIDLAAHPLVAEKGIPVFSDFAAFALTLR